MKRILLIAIIAVSTFAAQAQVDPVFTEKFVTLLNTIKDYHSAAEVDKPAKLELTIPALHAFYPITSVQFSAKANAMMNSPTELAKLPSLYNLIVCVIGVAQQYQNCLGAGNTPTTVPPSVLMQCNESWMGGVAMCAYNHL